jgi:hypothetical protein
VRGCARGAGVELMGAAVTLAVVFALALSIAGMLELAIRFERGRRR